MKKSASLCFLAFLILGLNVFDADACLHFPGSYKEVITQKKQDIFIFHDGKFAHMILSTQLSASTLPSDLAWVLPFPSLPVRYEQMKPDFFKTLDEFTHPNRAPLELFSSSLTLGLTKGGSGEGIKIHEVQQVGDYQIQPIEILKEKGGKEFNEWLTENKFNPMPDDLQKYYLKKGAVFLAIRMKPSKSELSLNPLHVVYPSDRISIPLKFTHDTRTFDLQLYVFTPKPLPKKIIEVGQFPTGGLRLISSAAKSMFDAGIGCFGKAPYDEETSKRFPELLKLLGNRRGYITSCESTHLWNRVPFLVRTLGGDPGLSIEDLY